MRATALVVEDEPGMRDVLETLLRQQGYDVTAAGDVPEALKVLASDPPDVILTDLKLPSGDGLQILEQSKHAAVPPPVIIITAHGSVDTAVQAVKRGAYDFITKPFDEEKLFISLERALSQKRLRDENMELRGHGPPGLDQILTQSSRMKKILDMARDVADSPATTVLIRGESGTGKEVLARAIHVRSQRRERRFVAIHCAAIPDTLLESELFGFEKGAFTGAIQRKKGKLEVADGGTVFLDEIGDLAMHLQVKLLRVLQEKSFDRLGGLDPITVDVRVIAATHRNLEALVREERFRSDLFYRLNVFVLELPPLRERTEDIDPLARRFLAQHAAAIGKEIEGFSAEAVRLMKSYSWPGNIREMENAIERAVILCKGARVEVEHMVLKEQAGLAPPAMSVSTVQTPAQAMEDYEKGMILDALKTCGGNQSAAAERLGFTRSKFRTKLAKYGISAKGEGVES